MKDRQFQRSKPLPLTEAQQRVFSRIREAVDSGKRHAYLLHGVTGSGKTEIYLQAIARCLELGREAIVLVPEISLTPQMVERFKGRFGDLVAVMHSRLSHGERYDEWRKIADGGSQVVVGARSAVFAPFRDIGIIIIDEEHEIILQARRKSEVPCPGYRHLAGRAARGDADPRLGHAVARNLPGRRSSRQAVSRSSSSWRSQSASLGGRCRRFTLVDMREELQAAIARCSAAACTKRSQRTAAARRADDPAAEPPRLFDLRACAAPAAMCASVRTATSR